MSVTGAPGTIAACRATTEPRQEIDTRPCLPSTSSAYILLWKAVHASEILAQVHISNFTKRKIFKNQHQQECIDCFPVDCVVGNWSTWGLCSQSCGGGLQENMGKECPHLVESRACNTDPCPGLMMLILLKIKTTPQLIVSGSGATGATAQQLVKGEPRQGG